MAVKIRLKRLGKIRAPYYRIVVADSRTKRDGRAIEEIGIYHPKENPSRIEVQGERAQYWLGVGAQPTGPVLAILKLTGDWQTYKGLPAPPPLLVKEPKVDRSIAYHEAVAQAKLSSDDEDGRGRATTARRPRKTAEAAPAGETVAAEGGIAADAAPVDEAAAATARAEAAPSGDPAPAGTPPVGDSPEGGSAVLDALPTGSSSTGVAETTPDSQG